MDHHYISVKTVRTVYNKVKTQDFGEDDRSREKSYVWKIVGKFPEKPETIDYYILRRIFSQFTFSTNFPELVLNISVRQ